MTTGNMAAIALLLVLLVAVVYGITQMETEVIQTLLAVSCGMASVMPTAILVVALALRQMRKDRDAAVERNGRQDSPPVVVIQGGQPVSMGQPQSGYLQPPTAPSFVGERNFVDVVGDDYT